MATNQTPTWRERPRLPQTDSPVCKLLERGIQTWTTQVEAADPSLAFRALNLAPLLSATSSEFRCALLLATALVLYTSCGGPAPSGGQPSQAPTAASSEPDRVDLDAIFPPGPGRDLLLNNCQTCHVWVPIVILQMDQNAWRRNSLEHRDRVEALSDEDFKVLYDYLSSTFTPARPVPKLPQGLLEAWTSY